MYIYIVLLSPVEHLYIHILLLTAIELVISFLSRFLFSSWFRDLNDDDVMMMKCYKSFQL